MSAGGDGGGDPDPKPSASVGAETSPTRADTPRAFRTADPAPSLTDGDVVAGRYRIISYLAKGGMGEVYRAEDQHLREEVALKILARGGAIERFRREIHLAHKVTHPNACRIFDVGYHGDVPFLTMELLDGETLGDRMKRAGRLSPEQALPLVRQMCAALDAIHRAGVIHRDLKPGNVILVAEPDGERAVLTDFGVARGDAGDAFAQSISEAGGVVGTLAYMAPEQLEAGEVGRATDIYALGLVIYEMVTGAVPFEGATTLSAAVKRVKESPRPPRAVVPTLDARWEHAILRCLARDPANRFASADQVVAALGRKAPARRLQWAIALVAAVLLALAAVGIVALAKRARDPDSTPPSAGSGAAATGRRSIAVLGFKNLSERPDAGWISTALAETLSMQLAARDDIRTIPGEAVVRAKLELELGDVDGHTPETLSRIKDDLGAEFVVVGSFLSMGPADRLVVNVRVQDTATGETVVALSESGEEAELVSLVERAVTALRQKLGVAALSPAESVAARSALPRDPQAARLYAEGLARLRLFDASKAVTLLSSAIAIEGNHALSHSALASAWLVLGYEQKANEAARRAFELSEALGPADRLLIAGTYQQTARDWDKAIEAFVALRALFPGDVDGGVRLADAQIAAGRGRDALETLEEVRRLPAAAGDPRVDLSAARAYESLGEHSNQATRARAAIAEAERRGAKLLAAEARRWYGVALRFRGHYDESLTVLEAARDGFASAGNVGGVAWSLHAAGGTLIERGDDDERAEKLAGEALETFRRIGDKHGEADALNNISVLADNRGDARRSNELGIEALEIAREIESRQLIALFAGNLAEGFYFAGELARASEFAEEARAAAANMNDRDWTANALLQLGRIQLAQGELTAARASLDDAASRLDQGGMVTGISLSIVRGLLLFETDDRDGARAELDRAVSLSVGEQIRAEARVARAALAVAEGDLAGADAFLRDAADALEGANLSDRIKAERLRAEIHLARGELGQAQAAVDSGRKLLVSHPTQVERFPLEITAAHVLAARGRTAEAKRRLAAMRSRAHRAGAMSYELAARLAIATLTPPGARRKLAEDLIADARGRGLLRIAREAQELTGAAP